MGHYVSFSAIYISRFVRFCHRITTSLELQTGSNIRFPGTRNETITRFYNSDPWQYNHLLFGHQIILLKDTLQLCSFTDSPRSDQRFFLFLFKMRRRLAFFRSCGPRLFYGRQQHHLCKLFFLGCPSSIHFFPQQKVLTPKIPFYSKVTAFLIRIIPHDNELLILGQTLK